MDEVEEKSIKEEQEEGPPRLNSGGSASSERSVALKELYRKPIKGDLREYIDFGSLTRKPKEFDRDESSVECEKQSLPVLTMWMMKDARKKARKVQTALLENSDMNSVSVFHLNRQLRVVIISISP